VFDVCNVYPLQSWTNASGKVIVKDCIATNSTSRVVDPSKKVPDLNCEVQDMLLEVVDLKQEVSDLRSDGIRPNLTPST